MSAPTSCWTQVLPGSAAHDFRDGAMPPAAPCGACADCATARVQGHPYDSFGSRGTYSGRRRVVIQSQTQLAWCQEQGRIAREHLADVYPPHQRSAAFWMKTLRKCRARARRLARGTSRSERRTGVER